MAFRADIAANPGEWAFVLAHEALHALDILWGATENWGKAEREQRETEIGVLDDSWGYAFE